MVDNPTTHEPYGEPPCRVASRQRRRLAWLAAVGLLFVVIVLLGSLAGESGGPQAPPLTSEDLFGAR
ncbi:MAG: hypothetical protein JWL64_2555 [Frankiales bacterium]|nr:hypothetical protein [Frankiales bacterium]